MSKRQILSALRRKGIVPIVCTYDRQATPGEMVSGWEIYLDTETEDKILDADDSLTLSDLDPDASTAAEALAWVETLPDIRAAAA
ncbi:hypothetical protein [Afifella pfennigii]|uniref:hypothetical protein n=1 Tax=Afifella pfennigii TaxID=209897 RepID=UPI00047D0BA6|nr:hypothetical protein [Afifella pfennigii]